MREAFATLARWLREGRRCAAATLVASHDAAPAAIGTTIVVDDEMRIAGNIGSGCHEAEIVDEARLTIDDGRTRLLDIDLVADALGGSGCGARLHVAVWRPTVPFAPIAERIAAGERGVELRAGGIEVFIPAKVPLVLVGATALAADVALIARRADFRVTVIDPRATFATRERLPDADAIVREWPDAFLPGTLSDEHAVVVLSHDRKFDAPALRCALGSRAWYVGFLGSRHAQDLVRSLLRAEGVPENDLVRIHGPVGLDLGGVTYGETAVAIVAELIACRRGRSARPLSQIAGALHA